MDGQAEKLEEWIENGPGRREDREFIARLKRKGRTVFWMQSDQLHHLPSGPN